jgi:hypothetical protein
MLTEKLKKFVPHGVAVLMFIALSAVYFYPQVEGFQLRQGDNEQYSGMSKEISDFREKYHSEPLWTNGAFSGMPAYQISTKNSNYVEPIENFLIMKTFSRPIGYTLLAMIGCYVLLLCFGVSPWISIIGSIAFGFASINMLYMGAGHNTKVHAISLLPMVIGALLLAYRKDLKVGALLFSFFLCLELSANHLQMTYYGMFLIGFIILVEFFIYLKDKLLLKFLKISSVLIVAAILGILPTFSSLYTTYEYGKYSTRGKSELTVSPPQNGSQQQSTGDALDPGYITQYSLGVGEVWSMVIPDVKGGSETYMGNKKEAMENVNPQFRDYVAQSPSYWGEQLFSGGAFYFGASMFVLFILGFIFIKDNIKWAFLAASVLAIVLSLKYGSILQFFIGHFPLFNKFRDTKMMLILVQIAFPFIGMLFVKELFARKLDRKKLLYSIIAINGILLLFYVMPSTFFDFFSSVENQQFAKQAAGIQNNPEYLNQFNTFLSELENARIAIFKSDVLRSLFFGIVVSVLVYLVALDKLKKNYFLMILGLIVLIDVWMVDKRYLNNEESGKGYKHWVEKQEYRNPYRASTADNFILNNELNNNPSLRAKIDESVNQSLSTSKQANSVADKEGITFRELGFATDYRVLTLQDPFSNGSISYFHKSIGGYHGAKLKKYQELIDFYLSREYSTIVNTIQDSTVTNEKIAEMFKSRIPVLSMLNTKYILVNPNAPALVNPNANGNCWFAKKISYAGSADEEILSLGKVDLKNTAVISKTLEGNIGAIQVDSTASIQLTSYKPNDLIYKSRSNTPQVAIFSEIYYPKGWNVYVDGKKSSYFSADYLLRGMKVPAGEHTIEYRFEPSSYKTGVTVSIASSILLLLLLIGGFSFEIYRQVKK